MNVEEQRCLDDAIIEILGQDEQIRFMMTIHVEEFVSRHSKGHVNQLLQANKTDSLKYLNFK
jgi:hypothetical protein